MTSAAQLPPAPSPPALLVGYDAALSALEEELARTGPGDRALLNVYLLEEGQSARRVLGALEAAAARGAEVRLVVDRTPASRLSRVWEGTGSLFAEARALARRRRGFSALARHRPDHSKYALFARRAAPSAALFGGINLGDRFRGWRDFMVRVGDADARALAARLSGAAAPPYPPPARGLSFVLNDVAGRRPRRLEVEPALRGLVADPALTRLRVAMSYIDRSGAALLATALARGVPVDLVLPARPNVYEHSNPLALSRLLAAGGPLAVRLHPAMVHAKALLAERAGAQVALIGSANLKRNSLRRFGELDAWVADPAFARALDGALRALAAEASLCAAAPRYRPLRARIEEWLG